MQFLQLDSGDARDSNGKCGARLDLRLATSSFVNCASRSAPSLEAGMD
jgi:hypothetical protein